MFVLSENSLLLFYFYGLPIYLVNIRMLYVLWRGRNDQFSSSYYRIFFVCGLNEAMLYFFNNYSLRMPSIPLFYDTYFCHFTKYGYYQTFFFFMRRFCSYFLQFCNPFLALNRMTAVWKYTNHEQIWSKYRYHWLIFASLGAFIMSFQELFNATKFETTSIGNITITQLVSDNALNLIDTNKTSAPTIAISTSFGIICTIITFIFWTKCKNQIPIKYRNFELKLIWLTLVFYTICLMGLLYHLLRFVLFDSVQQHFAYLVVSDSFALVPSLAFLIASPSLRAAVFPPKFRRLILCRTNALIPATSNALFNVNQNAKNLRTATFNSNISSASTSSTEARQIAMNRAAMAMSQDMGLGRARVFDCDSNGEMFAMGYDREMFASMRNSQPRVIMDSKFGPVDERF